MKKTLHLCDNVDAFLDEAVDLLNSIPARSRNAKINLLLGQMHLKRRYERSATSCFKDVLKVGVNNV
jgi:hypothetical protein